MDMKNLLQQSTADAAATGGARKIKVKTTKKVVVASAKSAYVKTKKTVKCGDGAVRPVYMKDGKAFYRKKDSKTGKLVFRVAPAQ
jgi:hypothetical protein